MSVRVMRDYDPSERGGGLEPGCDINRVTHRGEFTLEPDCAQEDGAGMHPDSPPGLRWPSAGGFSLEAAVSVIPKAIATPLLT